MEQSWRVQTPCCLLWPPLDVTVRLFLPLTAVNLWDIFNSLSSPIRLKSTVTDFVCVKSASVVSIALRPSSSYVHSENFKQSFFLESHYLESRSRSSNNQSELSLSADDLLHFPPLLLTLLLGGLVYFKVIML